MNEQEKYHYHIHSGEKSYVCDVFSKSDMASS
jgi:hypothetical protein